MRYSSETVHVAQVFETGRTVSVEVIDLSDDSSVTLTAGTTTESSQVDGLYVWASSDLDTQPTGYTEYAVVFTDGTSGMVKISKIVLEGYPATIAALNELVSGGRSIDFTGNDALGWQRIERDTSDVEVARYNLFDEDGNRITGTVASFIAGAKMIARETKI